ncbi:GNAT family N-acetyltransferase [Solwaraspora sp. WMMD791]|uniref:GNAT family N-acetyltransferase n=1 Tax=Solwaraspora sp. WMMD791 TaxID=3016086 RepID=UPI00249C72B1|nr:GNAT family N-acetyltransferase [Solwaraspora sp. WMMD791]WFE24966.1 GNAT family N-acetyltransferase [Solwaraspora sp. WMMD791]
MALILRPARLDDVSAVGHLHHLSRRSAYRGIVADAALDAVPGPALAAWWTERLTYERDTHRLTVAERDSELAGFTYVGPHSDGDPDTGELYAIHVAPPHQGTGIGAALLRDALDTMRGHRYDRAVLWVLAENRPARRFYEHSGWRPDGQRRDSWIGPVLTPQLRYTRALPTTDV